MNRMPAYILAVCFLIVVSSFSASAQIAWCSPKEVKWGDTVKIYYNPSATKATLTLRDDLYAHLLLKMWNGTRKDTVIKLAVQNNIFTAAYYVPDSVSVVFFNIDTPEKEGDAGDDFLALRKDGIPARGASINKIWGDSSAFTKELQLYPNNFSAFRERWDYLRNKKRLAQKDLQSEISSDLKKLNAATTMNAELLSVKAAAYSLLENSNEEFAIMKRLVQEFPTSQYTADYAVRHSRRNWIKNDSSLRELRTLLRSVVEKFPSSITARETVSAYYADSLLTLAMAKPVISAWIQDEPLSTFPYSTYIGLAKRTATVTDTVTLFAARMMDMAMQREVRVLNYLFSFSNTSDIFRRAAEGFELCGKYGQALAALQYAQKTSPNSEAEGKSAFFQGIIYQKNGLYDAAENSLVAAAAADIKGAKDSALAVYKHIRGTDSGFTAFIKQKTDSILGTKAKPALPFTVKALDGKTYDIAKLKGKAVVLNFWFIGCPPCRQEIPGLNTLVKEYAKKNVVFLALALDDEKSLNDFLKKTPFTYSIVPKAQSVSELYGVEGFPTHIVIDRKGMNIGQLIGGSETRHEDLRPLIERALGQ